MEVELVSKASSENVYHKIQRNSNGVDCFDLWFAIIGIASSSSTSTLTTMSHNSNIEDLDNKEAFQASHVEQTLNGNGTNANGQIMTTAELEHLIHDPKGWANFYFFFQSEW